MEVTTPAGPAPSADVPAAPAAPDRRVRPGPAVLLLGLAGCLLVVQSVVWEFVRMRPDYGYVVAPWALRGYESIHGWVAVSVAVAAGAGFALLAGGATRRRRVAVIVGVVVGPVLVATATGAPAVDVTIGTVWVAIIAAVAVVLWVRLAVRMVPVVRTSTLVRWTLAVASFLAARAVIDAAAGGQSFTVPAPVMAALVAVPLAALAVTTAPGVLAAHRLLVAASVAGSVTVALSAGAWRSTLVRHQQELDGVAARFPDTQVTSGYVLAVAGMALLTVACVALYARGHEVWQARHEWRR